MVDSYIDAGHAEIVRAKIDEKFPNREEAEALYDMLGIHPQQKRPRSGSRTFGTNNRVKRSRAKKNEVE